MHSVSFNNFDIKKCTFCRKVELENYSMSGQKYVASSFGITFKLSKVPINKNLAYLWSFRFEFMLIL